MSKLDKIKAVLERYREDIERHDRGLKERVDELLDSLDHEPTDQDRLKAEETAQYEHYENRTSTGNEDDTYEGGQFDGARDLAEELLEILDS